MSAPAPGAGRKQPRTSVRSLSYSISRMRGPKWAGCRTMCLSKVIWKNMAAQTGGGRQLGRMLPAWRPRQAAALCRRALQRTLEGLEEALATVATSW